MLEKTVMVHVYKMQASVSSPWRKTMQRRHGRGLGRRESSCGESVARRAVAPHRIIPAKSHPQGRVSVSAGPASQRARTILKSDLAPT